MKVGWDFIQLYNTNVLCTLLFWHIHASNLHVFGSRESYVREVYVPNGMLLLFVGSVK